MLSQSDRSVRQIANRYSIANASQIIAVTATDSVTATEGRTPLLVETNIIPSSNAPRDARLGMMATAPTTRPDTIEGIDLDAEVPCGHSQHDEHMSDEPAAYLVRFKCGICGHQTKAYPLCENGWLMMAHFQCGGCLEIFIPRDECMRIVEVLR